MTGEMITPEEFRSLDEAHTDVAASKLVFESKTRSREVFVARIWAKYRLGNGDTIDNLGNIVRQVQGAAADNGASG